MTTAETSPGEHAIAVRIAELRADAESWAGFAQRARAARDAADATLLDIRQLSRYGAELEGMNRQLVIKYSTLLHEAAENFDRVATALRLAADTYEAEEAQLLHDIKKNW
ncbi:hypothetical protein SAMN05443637_11925 [Pseudonocardia thermophila]|jgi:hypothetical protein|uniref:Excreted virulence factor EspC, type VII ESX diderm n=1 Tax=Pseudonocardia thermophila TaxID=1848 RepID=A0A1M6Y7E3_PSETH|nr:hypothetical protein [Pseudonocardia thermophila]SHL14111.1 hypothetical protein SAMN05443637_11925 [Pseudonocardia thermophila]